MPLDAKTARPIIVIKKIVSHGGHHGGAWKVAYADFVTAMMSLFIVLWLLNTSPQIKKAVAGYFNDPSSSGKQTGTLTLGSGESISIDRQNVEKLKEEIEKAILKQADLTKLSKQIDITVTGEGLKIDLIEDKGGTFFESGSPKLSENGVTLLNLLSAQLKVLPNRLLIEGHTDAQPYSGKTGYTNWELSSDRANSARRLLQQGGIGPNQISQVRGFGDQMLRVPSNPLDPSNRRVSLIVQWVDDGPLPSRTPQTPPASDPPANPTQGAAAEGSTRPAAGVAGTTGPGTVIDPAQHTASPPTGPSTSKKENATTPAAARGQTWIARIKTVMSARKH
jgi:chemotaxis protein MotB